MNANVWLDGHPVTPDAARVSVFDHGFLHGDSVFEVLRTYDGAPFALDERLERLERSARLVQIELPVSLGLLRAEVLAALERAAYPESYLRLMITRGIDELEPIDGFALPRGPRRVLLVTPLVPLAAETYERGIAAVTLTTQLAANAVAPGAKLGNYLSSVLALEAARREGAAEALLLDRTGRIVEGSSSNVFLVSRGTLVTPPAEAGILLGITRAKVLGLAAEYGVPIEQRTFTPAELREAEEAFVTASIREIVPVVRVDGHDVGNGRPGELTRRLLSGYRALAFRHGSTARKP